MSDEDAAIEDMASPKVQKSSNVEEESSGGEDEKKKGLYDLSPVLEGKRQRSKVERLTGEQLGASTPRTPKVAVGSGKGVALGDIKFIEHQIGKHAAINLKPMHRVLYGADGKATTLKKEIRSFNGYPFDKGSKEYERKRALVSKMTSEQLKSIKGILGLHEEGGSNKSKLVDLLLDFLLDPVDKKRKVPSAGKKRKATDSHDGKKKTSKKSKGEPDAKKRKKKNDSESGEELSESSSEDNEEDAKEEEPEEKIPQKKQRSKKVVESSDSSDNDQDNESPDESLDEVEKTIAELIDAADLKTVTLRSLCESVIEKHPEMKDDVKSLKERVKERLQNKEVD